MEEGKQTLNNQNPASFYDENNVFTTTDRLLLCEPVEEDMNEFMNAFATICPDLAKWYQTHDDFMTSYWEGVNSDSSLYCSIWTKDSQQFVGYCAIEQLNRTPPELSICLKKEFHGIGYGPEIISAFMDRFESIVGPSEFIAQIEADNLRSQHMFRKLGFKPDGIDTFIIKDSEKLRKFEEVRLGEIDDNIRTLADEFGVEPRKLLSHLLVFKKERPSRPKS